MPTHAAAVVVALAATLLAAPAAAARWAVGDASLPEQTALARAVEEAIGKQSARAPALKVGASATFLVRCSEAGCTPELVAGSALPADTEAIAQWARKWILPVTTPGLATPTRVWFEKPRKDEKKEKLADGAQPTKPPPGLRWAAGPIATATGALPLEEVLRAERLVFSAAAKVCSAETDALRPGTGSTTHWHVDVLASGSVRATPQDLYVPPPDPKEEKAKKAGEGAAAAGAALGLEAPKSPVPAAAPAEAAAAPARELTPLEVCVAFNLGQARFKGGATGDTAVDWLPVTVVP